MNCCSHLFEIVDVTPNTPNGCEECLKLGGAAICRHSGSTKPCGHRRVCNANALVGGLNGRRRSGITDNNG